MGRSKKTITLAHGNGGRFSHELVRTVFLTRFENRHLAELSDSAVLPNRGRRLSFTTDGYVVRPPFFPGGDIGRLAVCGTVNDLAVSGAVPAYMAAGFIIEEGFAISDLEKIADSMREAAGEADVMVVTGDTKVVEKGNADGIFITTSGIGFLEDDHEFSPRRLQPGDRVLVSGTLGDHAVAIMRARNQFPLSVTVESDAAPLSGLIRDVLRRLPAGSVKVLRDPTRGGLATTLNEFAAVSRRSIELDETAIPVKDEVRAVCELTGFDPLYLANEGKLVLGVAAEAADDALEILTEHPFGKHAALIGEVTDDPLCRVYLSTQAGGTRIVDMLTHDMLPRIC
ncbi:MAG TPA: hydrogenase expression/formation protein HypE [Spirochaetia bacterium]|nr:hydrogenase expression/formation protein HypE [Spirochaetia bacterium]